MRTIEYTRQFKRDFKRESWGPHRNTFETVFPRLFDTLSRDQPLPAKYRDHPLTGEWKDFRDCHIRPDLVLIYRKQGDSVLQLVRLGSHSELSL
ncbi:MAG: type II toxin-antitoxin system YafQ family toxin [Gammaproteobacteria bacterium]